jgi:branched-chain amino acid transport system ATP-binding protein
MTALLKPSLVRTEELTVKQKAQDVVDFLNLTHLSNELAGNLSGGQKKLLELGRTMMGDSKCVLLDEPGAGVNPTLMLKIIEMIRTLNEEHGYTFCIIEHDMDLIAKLCNNVIVLNEGQILMQGAMETVRNDERVIDAYFGGGVV